MPIGEIAMIMLLRLNLCLGNCRDSAAMLTLNVQAGNNTLGARAKHSGNVNPPLLA